MQKRLELFDNRGGERAGRRREHPDVPSGRAADFEPPASPRVRAHGHAPAADEMAEHALDVAHHPRDDEPVRNAVHVDDNLVRLMEVDDDGHSPQCTS